MTSTKQRSKICVILLGLLVSLTPLAAQAPIQIALRQGDSVSAVGEGQTVELVAPAIGSTATATINLRYTGRTSVVLLAPQLFGSDTITLSKAAFPVTLNAGDSVSFDVAYSNAKPVAVTSLLSIPTRETQDAVGTIVPPPVSGLIAFTIRGTAPDPVLRYSQPDIGNVIDVNPDTAIALTPVPLGGSSVIDFFVANRGSGPATVTNISVTGAAFQRLNTPALPVIVPPASSIQFAVRYTPQQAGSDSGTVLVTLSNGATLSATLQETAIASLLAYETLRDGVFTALLPNSAITFPGTNPNARSTVVVRYRNTSNTVFTVNNIAVTGDAFSIVNAPVTPENIPPGASALVTLSFNPHQPGPAVGNLIVGGDAFALSGLGLGANFSYSLADSGLPVPVGGAVNFPSTPAGQSARVLVRVTNNGSTPGVITSLALANMDNFQLQNPPALPVTLQPGDTLDLSVLFKPSALGSQTTALNVNNDLLTLTGSGGAPPPLPPLQFTGATGPQQPFTQPAIGLALTSPYPLDVKGTLTLTVLSDAFAPDPAVQFSTGGRTVSFSIPANTTQAVFANGSTQIRVQTGTVAGTVHITPTVSVANGVNVTLPDVAVLSTVITATAPFLLDARVESINGNAVIVQLTGYSATRTISKASITLDFTKDVSPASVQFSEDLGGISSSYFRSAQSEIFGGQFTLHIPFTLQPASGTSTLLPQKLVSATVTVSNELGASNSLKIPVH